MPRGAEKQASRKTGELDIARAKLLVEAILFTSDKPIEARILMSAAGIARRPDLQRIVDELNREYAESKRAFMISRFHGDKYLMHLRPEYVQMVRRYVGKPLMSSGLLRTLSFIAYHQPVQQSTVAAVRGGRTYQHISMLIERGLVEAERKGRTLILRTTKLFADYLGVENSPAAIRRKIQEVMGSEATKQSEVRGEEKEQAQV